MLKLSFSTVGVYIILAASFGCLSTEIIGQVVPGTGIQVNEVGDDFEDPNWSYDQRLPKVLNNKDETLSKNLPNGAANNARWYEGIKRGQPDWIRRISTPVGGLPESTGALELRSLVTGSSHPSFQQQQDDFIAAVHTQIGKIPVSQSPNVVTRVWLPPVDQWENRTGCHYAFRIALETTPPPASFQRASFLRLFETTKDDEFDGTYWPGIFINFESKEGRGATRRDFDAAYIWMKASSNGRVIRGPQLATTGWWTLGMSVTPDGKVHYYAKPGVEDLTAEDRIATSYPFGYRALRFRTFFFNVCNGDDGKTWSSTLVVDDPKLFVIQ